MKATAITIGATARAGWWAGLIGHLAANVDDDRKRNLAELRRAITSPSMTTALRG